MTKRNWFESPYVWLTLALASMMPFAFASIPPLTDYPNHLARYHVFLNFAQSPYLQKFYDVNWALTGNLGVDLLVRAIGPWVGSEPAARLVLSLIPPLTIGGIYALSRSLHGRVSPAALAATPLAHNFPFGIGLVNFSLSAAIAMIVLALWIRLRTRSWLLRFPLFLALGFLTWLAHTVGWGLLGIGVFGFELVREFKARGYRISTPLYAAFQTLPFALTIAVIIVWNVNQQSGLGISYHPDFLRAKASQFASLFREYNFHWDIAATSFFLAILAAFFWLNGRRLLPAAALICVFYFIVFLVVPEQVFQSGFIDRRVLPFAFLLLALSIPRSEGGSASGWRSGIASALVAATVAFFLVRMTVTTFLWASSSAALEERLKILDNIPGQSRLFALTVENCERTWRRIGRPDHLQTMAVVRNSSVVNGLFQGEGFNQVDVRFRKSGDFNPNMLNLVRDETCAATDKSYLPSLQWAISKFPRDSFEYLWLLSDQALPEINETGLSLVIARGNNRIYRIAAPEEPTPVKPVDQDSSPLQITGTE